MVYHDVVGLDVAVDDTDDLMAIMQGIDKICEILSYLALLEPLRPHVSVALFFLALFVVRLKLLVEFHDLVAEAALRVVLGHEVDVVARRVVDDLVEPDDIRMCQSLQDF